MKKTLAVLASCAALTGCAQRPDTTALVVADKEVSQSVAKLDTQLASMSDVTKSVVLMPADGSTQPANMDVATFAQCVDMGRKVSGARKMKLDVECSVVQHGQVDKFVSVMNVTCENGYCADSERPTFPKKPALADAPGVR